MSRRTKQRRWFRRLTASERPVVRTMARAMSRGDRDFAEDLEQEGLLAMYLMAPEMLERASDAQETARDTAFEAMKPYRRRMGPGRPCEDAGEYSGWMVITGRRMSGGGTGDATGETPHGGTET